MYWHPRNKFGVQLKKRLALKSNFGYIYFESSYLHYNVAINKK